MAGWSSRAISERTWARRAGLAARSTMELLRGSAISEVLKALSLWPGILAPPAVTVRPPGLAVPPSIRRETRATMSVATAWRSGMISTSVALDTSMVATMREMRCRLSA